MNDWPKGWRFWVLLAVLFAFPVVLHPWWLLMISSIAFALLVWAIVGTRKTSK